MRNRLLLLLFVLPLAACGEPSYNKSGFALDTFIEIKISGGDENILEECFTLIRAYENMFSRTIAASEVSALNQAKAPRSVPPDLYNIISESILMSRETKGLYDITIEPVMDVWDFGAGIIPGDKELCEALSLVGYENIVLLPDNEVYLKNGARIDLGSIAKGYITDYLAEYLKSKGVNSGIVDLGGNIYALGYKDNKDKWKIGIKKPFSQDDEIAGYFEVNDMSVVTAGVYQRYFEESGKIYHHIIDPFTGYPVSNELTSVSVVCASSTQADILSTACMLLGLDDGMALIEKTTGAEAVFITREGKMYYTAGIGIGIMFFES